MNIHVLPRTIYLTRVKRKEKTLKRALIRLFQHGESELNQQQRIGGDPPLSANGKAVRIPRERITSVQYHQHISFQYAEALAKFMAKGNTDERIFVENIFFS